jgi:hypothetical protein
LNVRDIPVSEFAIPKRLSDRSNVYAKASFLDEDIRPGVINERILCDDLARTLDEIDQEIERTPTEGKRLTIAPQHPPVTPEFKRTKAQPISNPARRGSTHGFYAPLRDVYLQQPTNGWPVLPIS